MATFRRGRKNNFTVVDNQVLKDDRLSWKAKGIISYIMSLPDDWEIHTKELVKHATDGRDSLMSGIKELRECGYIIYKKRQDDTGKFIHEYDVYDKPQPENPELEKPEPENPAMDNPTLEKPSLLQKTNELSTNQQNTNKDNKDSSSSVGSTNYPTLSQLERTKSGHRKYPQDFEDLWEIYPQRQGSNAKGGAYKKFRARMKEGIPYPALFKGVKTYMVEQRNKNNIGTPYIMQMKKFFGPQDIWLEYAEKDLTDEVNRPGSKSMKQLQKIYAEAQAEDEGRKESDYIL